MPRRWRSAVGAPIVSRAACGVGWASVRNRPAAAPETEEPLTEFTELLATAIANAESRAELDASRARIVATADATRRRIERDLHDGAQQQLVSLALEMRAVQAGVPTELSQHRRAVPRRRRADESVMDGLREIALGIHPAILGEGGLGPALKTLARRSPVPVELDVGIEGGCRAVEVAAYYVVSEALTNAAKHARVERAGRGAGARRRSVGSATTASAGPIRPGVRACSASRTAPRRSVARSAPQPARRGDLPASRAAARPQHSLDVTRPVARGSSRRQSA